MKEFSKNGKLGPDVIESIMSEEKPNQKEKFTFKAERLRQYIPSNIPYEKTEDYVLMAVFLIELPPHAPQILQVDVVIPDGQFGQIGPHPSLHTHDSFLRRTAGRL